MSFKTWKEEFYPIKPTKRMTTIEAIEHSIQKWEGLRRENLKRHEVILNHDNRAVHGEDSGRLNIDVESCALCVKFRLEDRDYWDIVEGEEVYVGEGDPCQNCPLYISRGGYACDSVTPKERDRAVDAGKTWLHAEHPYGHLCEYANPLPMLRELKKTLKMVQKQEAKNG